MPSKYVEGVGRRKTAIARVRIFTKGDKEIVVNGRALENYFPVAGHRDEVRAPLQRLNIEDKFRISVQAHGSGVHAQAQAIRHGLARALVRFNPDFRKRLKRAGYLTRDARMVERKKAGLKKARRAPQWQKR
ncbi:MAG: 30S ribosomal protein S9 [Candidatus Terrybacteria bacterium RIFCSPHIGHO2_01_FULL_48_17]|uniref:Small ribosomal subunit protein uS9 n=1 Tax=Candidatus Terrybacteria bacterium RIFCSPHIGHO2_01_FULL_48_17 TaxID=1802362 RepID=A0A1G2PHS2_9BACT|nr:MAG: 30S ribosomal protein S9 [Candidatus Terrybacteria bacterium RIFCSPHIGHO2_01_FULL_48_17]OHA53606.1 MAG: 30S ribosomal protein S9 [Candidatus Terrybacteria bacterium RIFCSPLOWO2_01_FULL_48_14]